MAETMWFDRRSGDAVGDVRVSQGSEDLGDPSTLLITSADALPDWVMPPPEIGGGRLKVLGKFEKECPLCRDGQLVRHVAVEKGLFVAECVKHGFAWYKRK